MQQILYVYQTVRIAFMSAVNHRLSSDEDWDLEPTASATYIAGEGTTFVTTGVEDISSGIYGPTTFTLTIEDSSNASKSIELTYIVTV